ncbi:hypothetical protein NDU88_003363 [Pleurodeles waltl]|uniref:Uncharacterized protein n=1 Tax=Pleurodeles waltl TaxID=8319 RepID=A0AAV7TPE5_PLEWA|nr:hypothetical protein NDU88_003363 [Pleurodeles waltl]
MRMRPGAMCAKGESEDRSKYRGALVGVREPLVSVRKRSEPTKGRQYVVVRQSNPRASGWGLKRCFLSALSPHTICRSFIKGGAEGRSAGRNGVPGVLAEINDGRTRGRSSGLQHMQLSVAAVKIEPPDPCGVVGPKLLWGPGDAPGFKGGGGPDWAVCKAFRGRKSPLIDPPRQSPPGTARLMEHQL